MLAGLRGGGSTPSLGPVPPAVYPDMGTLVVMTGMPVFAPGLLAPTVVAAANVRQWPLTVVGGEWLRIPCLRRPDGQIWEPVEHGAVRVLGATVGSMVILQAAAASCELSP